MTISTEHEVKAVDKLICLFNQLFTPSYHTILARGQEEPIYLPRSKDYPYNRIVFAHGSFSSALHEISHWCLAGKERRTLVDYGYWYVANRESSLQTEFYQAEVKPQALELLFTVASGRRFFLSTDNLKTGGSEATPEVCDFKRSVIRKAVSMMSSGIPVRATILLPHLYEEFYKPSCGAKYFQLGDQSWEISLKEKIFHLEKTMDF